MDFLRGLWHGTNGVGELRFIHPSGGKPERLFVTVPFGRQAAGRMHAIVTERNQAGYGVYYRFGISQGRSAKKRDIQWLTALWVDIDDADGLQRIDDLPHRLQGLYNPPNAVINSGGGWHGLWLLDKPLHITDDNRQDVERTLKAMATALDADVHATDVTRIFRLPGTINTKPARDGAMCEIHDIVKGRYKYEWVRAGVEPFLPSTHPVPRRDIPRIAYEKAGLPRWVESYIASGAAPGERNRRLFAAACEYAACGKPMYEAEAILGHRGLSDGLTQSEVSAAIRSAYHYAQRNGLRPSLGDITSRYTWGDSNDH